MSDVKRGSQSTKAKAKRAAKVKRNDAETIDTDLEVAANEVVEDHTPEIDEDLSAAPAEIDVPLRPEDERRGEGDTTHSKVSYKPSDFYLSQVYFDRNLNQFVASSLEFPDLKVQAGTKEQAYRDLERKLEGHLASLRNRNETVPDAVFTKSYPEKLEIPVSQGLYRRLDVLSRQEKQSLENLVTELLTQAMDRRNLSARQGGGGHPQQSRGERNHDRGNERERDRDRDRDRDNRGNRSQHQHNNRGGQNRRPQGRGYHESLENKENFLEYVRNLEKSGGSSGWRKK